MTVKMISCILEHEASILPKLKVTFMGNNKKHKCMKSDMKISYYRHRVCVYMGDILLDIHNVMSTQTRHDLN